jgi:peptidoglycan/LPS O-acetylase OafA/YrhL
MAALIRHGMPYFVVLPAMIAGMSAIAVLLYNLVEKPAKTWVGRWGRLLFGAVSNATLSFRPKTRVL